MRFKVRCRFTAKNKKNRIAWAFLSVSIIGVLIFGVLPLIDVLKRSLQNPMGTEFVGLQNYQEVLNNGSFHLAAINTLKFISIGIPALLGLSLLLAVWLREITDKKGKALRAIFLLPMVLPVSSLSFVWKLFFTQYGILNKILTGIGCAPIDFISSDCSFGVLIFTYIWRNFGYAMILWMAAMDGIDNSVYEAAQIDGAGKFRIFRSITLPLLRPASFTIIILSLLNSFKVFRDAYLIAGDYPHQSMYLLQHLFNNWFVKMDIGKITAAAVMVTLIICILVGGLNYGLSKQAKNKRKMR